MAKPARIALEPLWRGHGRALPLRHHAWTLSRCHRAGVLLPLPAPGLRRGDRLLPGREMGREGYGGIAMMSIPPALERLPELARNLWWSWHPEARALFEALENSEPEPLHHNPVQLLHAPSRAELEAHAKDPNFLDRYRKVLAAFDADIAGRTSWFASHYPELTGGPIAYFSAEFGVHSALP